MIADGQQLMTQSLQAVISKEEDMVVVGIARNSFELLEKCIELIPDLILTDIELPGHNSLVISETIKKHYPLVKVVILTDHHNRQRIDGFDRNSADAWALKKTTIPELLNLIRQLFQTKY